MRLLPNSVAYARARHASLCIQPPPRAPPLVECHELPLIWLARKSSRPHLAFRCQLLPSPVKPREVAVIRTIPRLLSGTEKATSTVPRQFALLPTAKKVDPVELT